MPRRTKPKIKPTKRIAALYCRVSTYDQTVLKYSSLDHQEEQLREWCKQEGWEIYNVYIDSAKSGASMGKRTELQRLISDSKKGKFNLVISTKIDRISRSTKDWFDLIGQFEENEIDFDTKSHRISNDDPYGKMFRNLLIVFAELERELIAERTFEKSYACAQKGQFIGGTVPMGYELQDKKMVVDPKYSKIILRIFNEYLNDNSVTKIAEKLNSEGFRTPSRVTKSGKNVGSTRGGVKFNKNKILSFLQNETYTGVIKFHDEVFDGEHKAIISKSLFKKVQKKKKQKTASSGLGIPKTSNLLLLGLLKCGYCGSNMTTSQTKKKLKDGSYNQHYYYKCTKSGHEGAKACPGGQISALAIEKFILDWIQRITSDNKEFLQAASDTAAKGDRIRIKELTERKSELQGNKKSINLKMDYIVNAIESGVGTATLTQKIADYESEVKFIEKNIHELDKEIDYLKERAISPEQLLEYLKMFVPFLDKIDRTRLQQFLNLILKDIEIVKPKSPDKKWQIKINPWSNDPRVYYSELLTGSCNRPSLLRYVDSNHGHVD